MISFEEFVDIIRVELGLPLNTADAELDLDQVPGWDSVYLLTLLTVLEKRTGAPVSLPDVLAATSLREIYIVVTAGAEAPADQPTG